jgi:ABC-type antimicrobial peptide transport system ATPase subunit
MKYNSINEIVTSPEWKEFIDLENKAAEERLANMTPKERMTEAMDRMVGPQDGELNMIVGKSSSGSSMIQKFLDKYQKDV